MLKGKNVIIPLVVFSLFISMPINQYVNAQLLPVPGIPPAPNPILPLDSTSTDLSINPTTAYSGKQATVTATVSDTTISINTPSGTVRFNDNGAGGIFGTVSCSTSNNMLICIVIYTSPNTSGVVTITGTYSGDLLHNTSSGAASLSVITTTPDAPTELRAMAVSTSQIDLSWNAPNDGGSEITGYQIERSDDDGATWSILTTTTSLTYSDTDLSPSTTYAYRVSAINSIGTSSPSNVASATTGAPPTAPQPPTNLSASAVSSSQINLSWNSPSDGGSAIMGYQIERSLDDGLTWSIIVSNTGSTSTAYSDTGLSTSTTYTYRVSAINSIGTSSPSNVASATTGAPPTAPQPPTNLSATTVSSSQIDLSWNAPANDGGSAITGYQIERSDDDGTTWVILVSNTASSATTYSDAGLEANTAYHYRVSAINSVGTSTPSNTSTATTNIQTSTITVYAHRIPASYWEPCFATNCDAGTGPGTTMYFGLYDSSGKLIQSGFADENGYTFSGLNPNDTYSVYPADCGLCHGSSHNVVFEYWGDNQSNVRPRATTVGSSLDAWYTCSNNCS